jgi:N4-gp56 family major capsid protein
MANVNVTTSLTQEVMTYYEKVFLARSEYELILKEGAQMRTHGANSGRTINFTRVVPMGISTTPLGEASNPTSCQLTASTVAVTLSEYGATTITSKLLSLVSIDVNMKEKVEVVGQNMGEVLNRIVRDELANGTQYIPNAHTTGNVAAGDTLSASAIREMIKNLEVGKARAYPDGLFVGKTNPLSKYSLLGDSTWINSKTYSDVKDLYKGEMGELYQVRWLLNKDVASANGDSSTAACTVVMYYTYVHGADALGCFDLAGDQPKLYVYTGVDATNTTGRATYISWAGTYASKLLNSSWSLVGKFTAA